MNDTTLPVPPQAAVLALPPWVPYILGLRLTHRARGWRALDDAKVAAFYFAVRVENQAATSSRVVVNGAGARVLRAGTLYPLRVEGADSAGRGLLELGVYIDREVSPQGDGSCQP